MTLRFKSDAEFQKWLEQNPQLHATREEEKPEPEPEPQKEAPTQTGDDLTPKQMVATGCAWAIIALAVLAGIALIFSVL